MTRSKQNSFPTRMSTVPPTSFESELRLALSHFHEPEWLAAHSPLAAPYFLGGTLQHDPETGMVRAPGEQLCAVLLDTALLLWGGPLPAEKSVILAKVEEE